MRGKYYLAGLGAASLGLMGLLFFSRPCLFVTGTSGILAAVPISAGMPFSIRFIHSVQKTPVEEFFLVNESCDGFILHATKYQSFGVGLPFSMENATFRQEGDFFVLEGIDRPLQNVAFRPGTETNLTLYLAGNEYRFYELVPLGSVVYVYISPYYCQFAK